MSQIMFVYSILICLQCTRLFTVYSSVYSVLNLHQIISSLILQGNQNLRSQVWKDQLNPEEREVNRTDLANLQARVDYLKNPRHEAPSTTPLAKTLIKAHKKPPKEVGIKPAPEKSGWVGIAFFVLIICIHWGYMTV